MHFNQILKILFLSVGGILCLIQLINATKQKSKTNRLNVWILAILSVLSCWSYFEFGDIHQYGSYGKHFYHYHEIYHYYVGAKFYPELGNTRLYDCTYIAFDDLSHQGINVPKITSIRSLEDPSVSRTAEWVLANKKTDCLNRFTPERWTSFKDDIHTLLNLGWYNQWWENAVFDLGFNPPPSWNIFGSTLAQIIPLNRSTIELLPFIDIILVFVVAGFLIFRTFGIVSLCAYLLIFGNNWLSSYMWTGGSYFRQVWFFLLVAGVCLLKKERYRMAGLIMGLSCALRIFPIFFAAGACIPLGIAAVKNKKDRGPLIHYLGTMAASFGALVLISLIVYGPQYWIEFLNKITKHNHTYYVMHIGYEKFAVFSPEIGNQNFWHDQGLIRFGQWQTRLHLIYQSQLAFHWMIKLIALGLAIWAAALASPISAIFIFGSCLFYFFSVPANYYYIYLSILPVIYLQEPIKQYSWIRLALIFSLMILIPILSVIFPDDIVHNGYINTVMFSFLISIYASYLMTRR